MKSSTYAPTLFFMVLGTACAHLEINIVTGPSAVAPADHKAAPGELPRVLCRTAIVSADQSGRNPNDPGPGRVCHGKDMLTEPGKLATLTAGGDFQWEILEDRLGSGHDGGQCSWWVSNGTDQTTWFKFKDDLDCTAAEKPGVQTSKIKIPTDLPKSCAQACTLNWLWAPLNSAKCEVYSNCFDVKINGVQGGVEDNYPMKRSPFECVRVNTETHKTSMFGRFINVAADGAITLETVVDGDKNCYQYTVKGGDVIEQVRAKFDISAAELYRKNMVVMPDSATLPANGTKLIITGCGMDIVVNDASGLLHVLVAGALAVVGLSF